MHLKTVLQKTLRTGMAASMVFVWYLAPALKASAATDQERALDFASQVKSSMQAIEDGDRDAPRDRWDPQYIVDTVGIEPDDLTRWVQNMVRWMPYRGSLRGAEGVLMDRVGNSLDQSLLLVSLLKIAGHDVRLAHSNLTPPTVERLWQELIGARNQPVISTYSKREIETPAVENKLLVTADLYGIDHVRLAEMIASIDGEATSLSTTFAERIRNQTERLAAIVGPIDSEAVAATIVEDARRSLADHWWVQVKRDGRWVDIDLMASHDNIGETQSPAVETFDPDALPADMEQHVIVRVIVEQLKNNSLTEHTVLEQSVRPRDLQAFTLGFRHFPMAWPEKWPQVTPEDIQIKLRAALLTQTEWLPVLVLRDVVVGKEGVFDTGDLDPTPHPVNPFMQMSVGMIGQISKATDVLASGGDPDALLPPDPSLEGARPPRIEGELVAEKLEYEIQVPGLKPYKISREVFDLIDPATRAAGNFSGFKMSDQKALDRSMAMLGESEIQILDSRISPEFLTHLGALNAIGNRPVLDELSRDPFGKLPSNFMELFSKLNGMPAALLTLAALRFDLNPFGDWMYVDRPSIVAQHTRLRRSGGGDFVAQLELDIVENAVGVDPLAAGSATFLRMSQGVADTNAEAEAMAKVGTITNNTAAAFFQVNAENNEWRLLRPGDQQLLSVLGYEHDVAARISEELTNGWLVALPLPNVQGQAMAGWWRIDPHTGATLGISPSGHGQALVEYALIIFVETMMAGAQCALAASIDKALEKTLTEKAKGSGSSKATSEGLKTGFEQLKNDVGNTQKRNQCIALGLFAGFRSLLLGFALHAVRTRGDRGQDGSKNQINSNKNNPPPPMPRPNPPPTPPKPAPPTPPTPKSAPPTTNPAQTQASSTPSVSPQLPPRVPTAPTKDLGPFQSDPVGLNQLRGNKSLAGDAIGPIERFEQADRQSKLTYNSVRGDNKSPAEARKISEDSWWDSYRNFHNSPLPSNLTPPRGAPAASGDISPLSSTLPGPPLTGKTAIMSNAGFTNQMTPDAAKTAGLAGLAGALEPLTGP